MSKLKSELSPSFLSAKLLCLPEVTNFAVAIKMCSVNLWLLFTLHVFLSTVRSQFGPDPRWLNPDGSHPDFTTTYSAGDTVELSWKALNDSKSDLWLTHHDATTSTFNVSLTKNVDISVAGTYKWTIDVGDALIKESNQFVLRFYPAGSAYFVLQFQQNISPGFIIASKAGGAVTSTDDSTTTSTSSSSTSTSTSGSTSSAETTSSTTTGTVVGGTTSSPASASLTGTAVPNATPSASPSDSSSGLSNGAKAGIAVGAVAGILALLAIGCFLGRRYTVERRSDGVAGGRGGRHRRMYSFSPPSTAAPPYRDSGENYGASKTNYAMAEMPGNQSRPAEVQSGSVMVKPGLHELRT